MKLFRILAALVFASAAAVPATAQCLVPDNLDVVGGACFGAQTNVPQRGFIQPSLGICWNNCNATAVANMTARWGALNPQITSSGLASCAWYRSRVRLYVGAALQWDGQMNVTYSRTWVEVAPSGTPVQVWRYLVNGDMQPNTATTAPCGIPPCAPPHNFLVRFTGYVDYAYDCSSTLTERAWMLTHACDSIDHAPGFPRAGVFHPNTYYTFVGPSAGFVVGAGGTLESSPSITTECVRKWDALAVPARCTMEETLAAGSITPGAATCMCGVGPANWYQGQLFVAGSFGTVVAPFAGSDPFRSFAVGTWTNPGVFPGVEEVRWNCNEAQYTDCTGVSRMEYYFGATTAGGFPAFSFPTSSPSAPLPQTFIDQGNSVILPANIATQNRPYRTDHILNLNI